jgi:hypothetical protein
MRALGVEMGGQTLAGIIDFEAAGYRVGAIRKKRASEQVNQDEDPSASTTNR